MWVPANLKGEEWPCDGLASHPGGSKNTLSLFTLQKPGRDRDKGRPDGTLGWYTVFTLFTFMYMIDELYGNISAQTGNEISRLRI